MATTKINTLKQLRKAPNNGVVLATEGDQLVWKNVSDFTTASDASARTIANEVVEAKKAEIISQVNTAKFIGPVTSTTAVDLGAVDSNDLVLVGTQAPYAIYAKINDALVKLGQTDVDLSAYETTSSVDQKVDAAKNELTTNLLSKNDFQSFKTGELPVAIATAGNEIKREIEQNIENHYLSKNVFDTQKSEILSAVDTAKESVKQELSPKIKKYNLSEFRYDNVGQSNVRYSGNYTRENGYIVHAYLNGVLLKETDDYTIVLDQDGTMNILSLVESPDAQDVLTVTVQFLRDQPA